MDYSVFIIEKYDYNAELYLAFKARNKREAVAVGWAMKEDKFERERGFSIYEVQNGDSIELTRNPASDFEWKQKIPVNDIEWFFQEPATEDVLAAAENLDAQLQVAQVIEELGFAFDREWKREERRFGNVLASLAQDYDDFLWDWAEWREDQQKWIFYHNEFE